MQYFEFAGQALGFVIMSLGLEFAMTIWLAGSGFNYIG